MSIVSEASSEVLKSSMSEHEFFMRQVYLVASRSKDGRTKIGSILTRNGTIISSGFNGFPIGVKDYKYRYEHKETKYQFVAHSEFNSIVIAARNGISTFGSTLFTQGTPCSSCAKAVIQAGVTSIVLHKQWPNLTHSEAWIESTKISNVMLDEAGIKITWFDKVLGLKGFLDGKEISV